MPALDSDTAILRVADAIGGLMEFWGFKRNMGRMWAMLYLSPQPLSSADLCERLSLSTGSVSMTLAELSKWGVVKKAWMPGQRRDYYEPETSIWKMVSRVFRERELRQIQAAIDAFEAAIVALGARRENASPDQRASLDFVIARIEGLLSLARIGSNLLDAILAGKSIDALPLVRFTTEGGEPDDSDR